MADDNGLNEWVKEDIPDIQCLFMRVHRNNLRDGSPNPGAFKDHGTGMSADWCKYGNPQRTQRAAINPGDNGVVQMLVLDIRSIEGLTVEHTPDVLINNRAHVDVFGDKSDVQTRVQLRHACKWVIPVPQRA